MNYLGDYAEDETIYVYFTTNDKDGGAVAPSSAFENADVKIFKDGSATEKTSVNGLTMTSPFNTTTGLHLLAIDTSNDTDDADFWVTGSDFTVILDPSDETVDSETVVGVIATFSIENRCNKVNLTHILGHLLTNTGTQIADAFQKFFDVGTPVFTAESVNQTANNNTILANATYGNAALRTRGDAAWISATGFATNTKQDTMETTLNAIPTTAMRGTDNANIVVPPSVAQFNARSIPSADYVVVSDTIAGVTLVDTVTTNSDLVTAGAIKTALEADNSDLDYLVTDLINQKSIKIATGISTQYNDAGASLGAISSGYGDDGVDVSRPRQVIVK